MENIWKFRNNVHATVCFAECILETNLFENQTRFDNYDCYLEISLELRNIFTFSCVFCRDKNAYWVAWEFKSLEWFWTVKFDFIRCFDSEFYDNYPNTGTQRFIHFLIGIWQSTFNGRVKITVSHCSPNEHLLLDFYECFKSREIKKVISKLNKPAKTNLNELC